VSFNVSAQGSKEEVANLLKDRFKEAYADPAEGVAELVDVGVRAVEDFVETSTDEGSYSVVISGHAKQSDTDRDSLAVSISAITTQAAPAEPRES